MNDLDEQRAALARAVAECDARHVKPLSQFASLAELKESEERYRLEREPLIYKLMQYMAAERCGLYLVMNPITLEHCDAARLLVEKAAAIEDG